MRRSKILLCVVPGLFALDVAAGQDVFNWSLAGSSAPRYTMSANGSPLSTEGATLALRSSTATVGKQGAATATMNADTLAGRRVRISADIETKAVSGSASVWLRADSAEKVLILDNGTDNGIKGTTTSPTHVEVALYVPASATKLAFGLLLSGPGHATARHVHITVGPRVSVGASLAPEAQHELDSAIEIVRGGSLWRDTITWSAVESDVRALATGSETAAETYPAIRALLARLGDHHSFLMDPQKAAAFQTGGMEMPRPLVRVQRIGIGYISVPTYMGSDSAAAQSYVQTVYDSVAAVVANGAGMCRWVVDLRDNGGGNMWPMLGGLRPFLGEAGLGSFDVGPEHGELWHARDAVDLKPPVKLAPLESANVAVLYGPITASSGEAVAISFIGRPRTRSFGLPTKGLSTANDMNRLPDGAIILLTRAVESDRNGKRYGGKLAPDELVPAPKSHAPRDPQLARAAKWLESQSCDSAR